MLLLCLQKSKSENSPVCLSLPSPAPAGRENREEHQGRFMEKLLPWAHDRSGEEGLGNQSCADTRAAPATLTPAPRWPLPLRTRPASEGHAERLATAWSIAELHRASHGSGLPLVKPELRREGEELSESDAPAAQPLSTLTTRCGRCSSLRSRRNSASRHNRAGTLW